jgi:hypothetical protein
MRKGLVINKDALLYAYYTESNSHRNLHEAKQSGFDVVLIFLGNKSMGDALFLCFDTEKECIEFIESLNLKPVK